MRKRDIIELMQPWDDDTEVAIVIADGAEDVDELENGSVLDVTDAGYRAGMNVLYVEPR